MVKRLQVKKLQVKRKGRKMWWAIIGTIQIRIMILIIHPRAKPLL